MLFIAIAQAESAKCEACFKLVENFVSYGVDDDYLTIQVASVTVKSSEYSSYTLVTNTQRQACMMCMP